VLKPLKMIHAWFADSGMSSHWAYEKADILSANLSRLVGACLTGRQKQNLLTDSFKVAADDRPRAPKLPARERPEVVWPSAGEARGSSRSRLRGDDFPSGAKPHRADPALSNEVRRVSSRRPL
jgi:hypothetical protein